ncbi:MAG: collagenase, partial [Algicola sp.]|nr:collagenase [Algicola sp.]
MTIRNKTTGMILLALASSSGVANAGAILTDTTKTHSLLDEKQHPSLLTQLSKGKSSHICGTDENEQDWHHLQKLNKKQLQDKSSFSSKLLNQLKKKSETIVASAVGNGVSGRYYIPVVVHVYGSRYNCTGNGGVCLSDAKIIDGLNKTNEDFLGTNTQDGPIATEFQAIRQNLNVEFVLAKTTPNGSPTTGIVRHTGEQSGYGNDTGHDGQISGDAWDNFKYMNVYIMQDLYADGGTTKSGVAWYPQMSMSKAGL